MVFAMVAVSVVAVQAPAQAVPTQTTIAGTVPLNGSLRIYPTARQHYSKNSAIIELWAFNRTSGYLRVGLLDANNGNKQSGSGVELNKINNGEITWYVSRNMKFRFCARMKANAGGDNYWMAYLWY